MPELKGTFRVVGDLTVDRLVQRVFLSDFARSAEVHKPLTTGFSHGFAELVADELL